MKKLISICLLAFPLLAVAQVKKPRRDDCGTPRPHTPYNLPERLPNAINITTPYLMKLFVHVCADDNGTNVAAPKADVMRQIENMRNFYAAHNICFILGGYEQIDDSDLNSHNTSTEAAELNPYLVPDHLNIFVHTSLMDNSGTLNGNAYDIPNWYLSIVGTAITSATNLTTLSHEMGHDFGLYHTFEQFWDDSNNPTLSENVPRSGACSNCSTHGDLICDTEADRNETVDAACIYSGTLRDDCNNLFAPNTHNIMTYGNRECRDFLTAGQGNRVRATIDAQANLSNAVAPDNAMVVNSNFTSGRQSLLARNTITINVSSYIVQGTTRMNMSAPTVRLQPGVRLSPSNDGYTKIRPNELCQ